MEIVFEGRVRVFFVEFGDILKVRREVENIIRKGFLIVGCGGRFFFFFFVSWELCFYLLRGGFVIE